MNPTLPVLLLASLCLLLPARAADAEIKDLSIHGGLKDGKGRLVIDAHLSGWPGDREKAIVASTLLHSLRITREKHEHSVNATLRILQGDPRELSLGLEGEGDILRVTGADLLDWSVRRETNGTRSLVLRPRRGEKPPAQLEVAITAERALRGWVNPVHPLTFAPPDPALGNGYVRIEATPDLSVTPTNTTGLVPLEPAFLPEAWRSTPATEGRDPLAFRFHGSAYKLPLLVTLADPEAGRVVLRDFQLQGRLSGNTAAFTLTAQARVKDPRGGRLVLLGGGAALSELDTNTPGRLRVMDGQFILGFDQPGDYPVRLQFHAAVRQNAGWQSVDFKVAPSALQPITLSGLGADTQFEFTGAARPERAGSNFVSYLPPDGRVKLAWKEARAEAEGRLFYAANLLSQITISPGLMRQIAMVEARVMQGELSRLTLEVRGPGNVTAVQGPSVLAWNLEPGANASASRRLVVQFNQPQKESATLQVAMQSELGAFPQSIEPMQVRPEGATRVAGHLRVINEGAVRLEVTQAPGLSQISPDQFPQSDLTKALPPATAAQRFAFRFSSADFALKINADNILPEVGVSELLGYHLGETELAIDADLELDIREAPLRELLLRVPRGYAVARLQAAGLADYFVREPAGQADAELRLVYSQPVTGRQLLQLRLERNGALGQAAWNLPRVEVLKAKSTRGHLAVSADPGFRLTPERTSGLTDIATAFHPRKVPNIQAAFRLAESAWEASLRVERLPQSIQADVLHLFSIGEGIAYGSSTMNFFISGAPVSAFVVALSEEYFNVEFTGKDLRSNWQKTTNGYLVSLNAPVSGAYTLLVTYERPFKAQGDTLAFTGARPLDAQTEQGHTLVVSAYQFEVTPAAVSPGLLELQTAEVPSEYRLFFDAPILKAYRYTTRPFNLQLGLRPLEQGSTLGLVVDRAAFRTRVSKDGEVVTDAKYYVKNRGNPHLRLNLPPGTTLWSATVNGNTTVPVLDGATHLIPLPQRTDPNAVQELDLKLASRSATPGRVTAAAPIVAAPVLLAEWQVDPDTGQVLTYRGGSLTPADGLVDGSGFAGLVRLTQRGNVTLGLVGVALAVFAAWAWRWAAAAGTHRFSLRHVGGTVVGLGAFALASLLLTGIVNAAWQDRPTVPPGLTFRAPVQQAGSALTLDLGNSRDQWTTGRVASLAWPALLGIVAWAYAGLRKPGLRRTLSANTGWTLLAWAALRWPHGAALFLGLLGAFLVLHLVLPAVWPLFRLPPKQSTPPSPAAPAVTAVLLLGGLLAFTTLPATAATTEGPLGKPALIADSVLQEVRVENQFILVTARIRWQAQKDQILPLIHEPAVVTAVDLPAALKLVQATAGGKRQHQALALRDGTHDLLVRYQLQVGASDSTQGFALPTQPGLVNRLTLTLTGMDADVTCAAAVAVSRVEPPAKAGPADTNAVFQIVLAPSTNVWVGWKPRARDVRRERAVFFAEWNQLYVPAAGVLEGAHLLQVRPAQGELSELALDVPPGATITDVTEGATLAQAPENRMARPSIVSLWRFDPDTRKLRVSLTPAQSRPFAVLIRSQMATGPLPLEQSAGLLSVQQAAGQVGALGLATGDEVQLESAAVQGLSPINLEDFPPATVDALKPQIAGLTVRRAFRYTEARGSVSLKAAAVEPDVRVDTEQTLSLGEDRTVLAAKVDVTVTRAGVFRLSFLLATNLDVETLTGPALSHWTELRTPQGRIITLHLKGRTEGAHSFQLALAGPGTRSMTNYVVPRLSFREADKQRGQLTLVPEQGLRLQVTTRDGVTQLDPQKSGLRQKGLLAFRLLQAEWNLVLEVEQVDAWVQVTSLQHLSLSEAMLKVTANLQYQIENTGLKSLRVRVPTNAEGVRFRGDQVADFLPVPGSATNGLQSWEVKLHRRVIGRHLLQAVWQTPLPAGATNVLAQGVLAEDANLQRGFVTVQSGGRLQVRAQAPAAALQPAEWQSIPRALLQDIPGPTASHTFRLVEAAFLLPLTLERHGATKLLDARVQDATLTSVISDEGVMLTQLKLRLVPGDKRLLRFSLPPEAGFWFAFVNQNGVWPWREQGRILIPLEQQSRADQPITVEIFYSSRIGSPGTRRLDLSLLGPKLDLPLENITWQVYLNEKWHLSKWSGTLQLEEQSTVVPMATAAGVQGYLQNELVQNQKKTKVAEEMLSLGNRLLEQGDPQQARRAFQSAYGLSTHDQAFNEDARVQLQNLKLQQALIGLNVNQSAVGGDAAPGPDNVRQLRGRKDNAYTQQEAKQIMEANDASDNAALLRIAERLVQQQDAAVTAPAAIRATVPEQGRLLTFRRTVQVDTEADLRLQLAATARQAASPLARLAMIAGVFVLLALLAWFGARNRTAPQTEPAR